jgi:hypothetical protein
MICKQAMKTQLIIHTSIQTWEEFTIIFPIIYFVINDEGYFKATKSFKTFGGHESFQFCHVMSVKSL